VYYHQTQQYELFNLKDDLGEQVNLSEMQPEVLARLSAVLGEYLDEVDAQMPTSKASGELVPYPGPSNPSNTALEER
jgi:K+/H+ antiporter YhaU regulatory subunit KhtT